MLLALLVYAFSPLTIGLLAMGSFFGWRSFRKRYKRTGQLESRSLFAFRVLGISQLVAFCLLLAFLVATFGFGLFVAPLIVFVNALAAILIFIFSLLIYPIAKKWATKVPFESTAQITQLSRSYSMYVYMLAGVGIPVLLYVGLNGKEVFNEFLAAFTVTSGNVGLVENQPYEFQQRALYAQLAKDKQDPSVCENIEFPLYKAQCYQAADPEFPEYEKTCALYMKQGDSEQADYIQRDCLMNKIYGQVKSVAPADALDCDSVASQFSNNRQIDYVVKECRGIALIQKAIIQNNPAVCDAILQTQPSTQYDFVALKHAACVVHFHGSSVWKRGCDTYKDNDYFGINYSNLASCETSTVVPPTGASTERYWFQ